MNDRIKQLQALIANDDCKDCDLRREWEQELDKLQNCEHKETINLDNNQVGCTNCEVIL